MNTRDSYMPYIALVLFAGWMALEFWPWPKPPEAAYVTTSAHDTWEGFDTSTTNTAQLHEVNDLPPENATTGWQLVAKAIARAAANGDLVITLQPRANQPCLIEVRDTGRPLFFVYPAKQSPPPAP